MGHELLFELQSYSILCEYTLDKTEKMLSGVKVWTNVQGFCNISKGMDYSNEK